ncbi:Aste57867_2014 [Aphanomyces stellatus]|uniref:Aste57867_2014 protein n=1 Tax=Aphanomyces stellatus TaxID=120398 RepID=A0A485K7M2_9STRA|nr:hypothetical protein As57867_002012 [Aphanomyces stellatus]VFT79218.1 Aste57867_2014 [Aphanomyces stellatus]
MFAKQLYNGLLAWLDLLGYRRTRDGLLGVLADVLEVCATKGLKLHPKKCQFYVTVAKRCGRIICGSGVKHDPARVEALQQLPPPVAGADLQQHQRASTAVDLHVEQVFTAAGGKRNKQAAAAVLLADIEWTDEHAACLEKTKQVLGHVVELCHPDPEQRLCVFADASENHWGSVITQVPTDQLLRSLDAQDHQKPCTLPAPTACSIGTLGSLVSPRLATNTCWWSNVTPARWSVVPQVTINNVYRRDSHSMGYIIATPALDRSKWQRGSSR